MNRIEELVQDLCPKGVRFLKLDSVVRIRNGSDYKSFGSGSVPIYGSGGVMASVDTAVHNGPSVLIPRKGSLGNVFYVNGPFWTVDTIFYAEIDDTQLIPRFFYYVMLTQRLAEKNQAGGVPSMTQSFLKRLSIPVPPLEVQREIVAILDRFTQLEAELEGRRAQYRCYRSLLLNDRGSTEDCMLTLGEIFEMRAGVHINAAEISEVQSEKTPYPCYGGNGLRGYVSLYNYDGDTVFVGRQGALCGNVHRSIGKIYATEHAIVMKPRIQVDMAWVFHKLSEMNLNQYKTKSAQPGLAVGRLKQIEMEYVPNDVQQYQGWVLDRLDLLVNDISIGLPAELAARRKQYEYYRDRLLTFKELAS